MPPKISKPKQYRVLNPQGLPEGIPVLSWRAFNWYEGDVIVPEQHVGLNLERRINEGYVKEIVSG